MNFTKGNTFFFQVGNASKMNLVLQMMNGVALAGLAEGLALADRAGLQQKDVMEVLELTQFACPMLVDKGKGEFLKEKIFIIFEINVYYINIYILRMMKYLLYTP